MSPRVRIALATCLTVLVPPVAAADGPTRPWRAATAEELGRIVEARDAATRAPVPRAIVPAPSQRAYIDPVTNELVSSPVVPPEPTDDALDRAPQVPMQFERNAKGFYKLDTTAYQMRATARIGADGRIERDCLDPDHGGVTEAQR